MACGTTFRRSPTFSPAVRHDAWPFLNLLSPTNCAPLLHACAISDGRMQMVYAWYPEPDRIELRYVATEAHKRDFAIWRCMPNGPPPSLTAIWPLMGWYEREITDLFGLEFSGHPEPNRLVLHDGVSPVMPPFNPNYPRDTIIPAEPTRQVIPEVAGAEADVQLLPFGPVRADVLESGQFLFFYIGEAILHYHPPLVFQTPWYGAAVRGPKRARWHCTGGTRFRSRQCRALARLLPSSRSGSALCCALTRSFPARAARRNGAPL